jgi:hypothetical protein
MVEWSSYLEELIFLNGKYLGSKKDFLENRLSELGHVDFDQSTF